MLKDVVEVKALDPYKLFIRFEDGVEGVVALDQLVTFDGVFAPLREASEFRKVSINPEFGVIHWPNGADLDSDVLYARLTHSTIQVKTFVDR
jgi:Protein of unknown function (DUF2442)